MIRRLPSLALALLGVLLALPVELSAAPAVTALAVTAPQQRPGPRGRGAAQPEPDGNGQERPARNDPEYSDVIPDDAVTKRGLFDVHEVDDDLFFEIPVSELGREMVLIKRTIESTLQDPGEFFPGGPRIVLQWERDDDRILLRQKRYDLIADTTAAVWGAVAGFRRGPILATFDIEVFGPDSAAVIDVSDLFVSGIPEFDAIDGLQGNRSWVERTAAFEDAVNIQVVQGGRAPAPGGRGATGGGGRGQALSQSQTVLYSMARLPDEPMMPRWHDERVGFNSSRSFDFSRPDNRLEQVRMIHRHRLEKRNPDADVSDPVKPIVYWIDPATPEWLQPWIVRGVNAWRPVFEGAGFTNATNGATALTESWQALPSVSNNHLMLGHIMQWFYEGLAGISQAEKSIGYKNIVIRPQLAGDITHAGATYQSPYGEIKSYWKKTGDIFELKISLPANCTATVYLPGSDKPVNTGSGSYVYTVKLKANLL
jgi:hypothetical protein